ncbi:hypothetical protein BKA93DRAFT_739817 [Sparassis latifolia]
MARHSQEDGLQHLANKKWKVSKKRFSWRRRYKPRIIQRTEIEKALLKAKRDEHQKMYFQALQEARDEISKQAERLRDVFGSHTTEYYYKEIMQATRLVSKKRKANCWNTYLCKEVQRKNEGKLNQRYSPGVPHKKASVYMTEIVGEWNTLSHAEKVAAIEDYLHELDELRDMKATARHNVPLNAFQDARTALNSIQNELDALSQRTGTETLLFMVRSSTDQYNQPFVYHSNERLAQFFHMAMKTDILTFVIKMEAFGISGVEGVVMNHVQEVLELKRKTAVLINQKLNDIAPMGPVKMWYKGFDDRITARHRVMVENWPLLKFISPGDVTSKNKLQVLFHAWESGTAHFRVLGEEEFEWWEEEHFQEKMQQMRGSGG